SITQFKSCFCSIEQDLPKAVADKPCVTLCADLSCARSRINVLSDQEACLCGVVKAIDRPIKSHYLKLGTAYVLHYTGLISADDNATFGSAKACPDIHPVIGTSISASGKHYCSV